MLPWFTLGLTVLMQITVNHLFGNSAVVNAITMACPEKLQAMNVRFDFHCIGPFEDHVWDIQWMLSIDPSI